MRNFKFNASILIIILLYVSLAFSCMDKETSNNGEIKAPVLVQVMDAEKTVKKVEQRFSGYAWPWETHGVGFLVAGRVTSIDVKEGELVSKGRKIATLDPEDYKLVQRLAQAQYSAIKPNYERVNTLVEKNVVPQSELDVLQGKFEAAQTQKEQAKRQLEYTRLNAPVAGVVHDIRTAVGQVIGQGSPAVILMEISRLKVKFGITQKNLKYFKKGDELFIDFPGVVEKVKGRVYHIDYVADKLTRTYGVVIEVANPKTELRPSMLAHLTIEKEALDGFFLPISAINRTVDGGSEIMIVDMETNKIATIGVKLGRRFEESIEIVEGLIGGEKVVVKGNNFAQAGDEVQIR